jgi:hypothetical protein
MMVKSLARTILLRILCSVLFLVGCWFFSDETAFSINLPVEMTSPQTKQIPPSALRFLVIGDGGSGMTGQKKIATQMLGQYEKNPYKLILMLGDNIYPDGDVHKYGKERFLDPYSSLLNPPRKVSFKPVLGNHDVLFGFQSDSVRFFKMPAAYYDFTYQGACFYALNTNAFDSKQAQWLGQRLKACKLPWKIVYGHHPMFSSGLHGSTAVLLKSLLPILEQNRVNLYLSGHDHDYERFKPVNGVHYIVSGGGGASLRGFNNIIEGSEVHFSKHHYLVIEGNSKRLTFQAIDTEGKLLDSGEILR